MTSQHNNKKKWTALGAGTVALAMAIIWMAPNHEITVIHSQTADSAATQAAETREQSQSPLALATPSQGVDPLSSESAFVDHFVQELKKHHANDIHLPIVQVKMHDFKLFAVEQFPETGVDLFQRIMMKAFPDHYGQILKLVALMDAYTQWYADNLRDLNELSAIERKGQVWGKRRELFGELAQEIWQYEEDEAESKRIAVHETLDALRTDRSMPLSERLYILQNAIVEQYGPDHEQQMISKSLVADVYFNLDSVQQDLHDMSPQERAEVIANSRRQLGFTEEDIQYLAQQDAERESRWQKGYAYMEERDAITQQYSGDELMSQLQTLREKHFGREAPTIAKEEESGFMRYTRPRLYGSN